MAAGIQFNGGCVKEAFYRRVCPVPAGAGAGLERGLCPVRQGPCRGGLCHCLHQEKNKGIDLGNGPQLRHAGMEGEILQNKNGKQLTAAGEKRHDCYPLKHEIDLIAANLCSIYMLQRADFKCLPNLPC